MTDVDGQGRVTVARRRAASAIPARTVLWAAGVQASPLAALLASATGAALDRAGRVVVEPDCTLPGQPGGVRASATWRTSRTRRASRCRASPRWRCSRARYVAGPDPAARCEGRTPPGAVPLQGQRQHGDDRRGRGGRRPGLAAAAAATSAWLAWLFVHILYLIEFENRVLVLFQWAWNYFTRNRAARLITGPSPLPLVPGDAPAGVPERQGGASQATRRRAS